jgi:hypothetical protein
MLAAKLHTGARSAFETVLTDRDLTVTQANVRKPRETLDLKIGLN